MRRTLLAAIAACATLTACGSNVQLDGANQSLTNTGDGLGGLGTGLGADSETSAPQGETPSDLPSTDTAASSAPTDAPTSTDTTETGAPLPTATTGSTGIQTSGPATLSPVDIGVVVFPDVAAFSAALGGSGEGAGDQVGMIKTAAAWVNANGGLAGHKINLVISEVQLTDSRPYDETVQQICQTWTQDHKVIAGIAVGSNIPNSMPACLSQKKVLYISGGHFMHDTKDYQSFPYMVSPQEARADVIVDSVVPYALEKKAIKKGDKVGVLFVDYPTGKRAGAQLEARLKSAGMSVTSYQIHWPDSTPDLSRSLAEVQSAELAMKAAGATTVFTSVCPQCLGLFLKNAESQKYYPRYITSSFDTLATLTEDGTNKQLTGLLAMGWNPTTDVGTYANPNVLTGNPSRELCHSIEKKAGLITNEASEFAAMEFCDPFLLLRAAAIAGRTNALSGTTLLNGINTLGTSHPSALNFKTSYSTSKHSGAAAFRSLSFVKDCGCLRYDSPKLYPIR